MYGGESRVARMISCLVNVHERTIVYESPVRNVDTERRGNHPVLTMPDGYG